MKVNSAKTKRLLGSACTGLKPTAKTAAGAAAVTLTMDVLEHVQERKGADPALASIRRELARLQSRLPSVIGVEVGRAAGHLLFRTLEAKFGSGVLRVVTAKVGLASKISEIPHSDVIVIGAGAAGLSAAKTLAEAGKSATVLEARDRKGGRAHTDESWGVPLDDGGSWIHGPDQNPLVEIAESLGIPLVEGAWDELVTDKRIASEEEKAQFGAAAEILGVALEHSVDSGRDLSLSELVKDLRLPEAVYESLKAAVLERDQGRADEDEAKIESAQARIDAQLETLRGSLEGAGSSSSGTVSFLSLPFCATAVNEVASMESGQSAKKTSTLDAGSFRATDDDATVQGGLGNLINQFGKDVPVELSTVAKKIEWGASGVRVTTHDGRQFTADKLLLTVPVSVLSKGKIDFDPPLPSRWTDAFDGIPMALMNKVHLQFKDGDIFGAETDQWISIAEKATSKKESGVAFWLRPEGNGVVSVFYGGKKAKKLEARGEEAMIEDALKRLREVYGTAVDQNFVQGRATQWGKDPFSLGAYSAAAPGQASLRENLREDVDGRLFYAGEAAASLDKNGSVGGAVESGTEAANRILEQLGMDASRANTAG